MKLAGRIGLVTGAQQGIGAAIAIALAEEGADVAITWLDNEPAAKSVAARIRKAGRRPILSARMSRGWPTSKQWLRIPSECLGAADILINNAGVYPRVKLLEMREADWDYVLDINLKAGCFATIAFVKALMSAGKAAGSVINISSQAIRGAVRGVHYSASKGGVVSMFAPRRSSSRRTTSVSTPSRPVRRTRPSLVMATQKQSWSRWLEPFRSAARC